jgi:micrococcal nuclease|tara:strand:- start:3779 stop:4408 length:630 start_codon:yes stop_codon:yes gene_type:complete
MDDVQLKRYNRFRTSLCTRIRKRFAQSPTAFVRVSERIQKRFSFNCGGAGSAPRETGPETRKRFRSVSRVNQEEKAERVTVNRVIDGDTVEVRLNNGIKETVRIIGIDAPEVDLFQDKAQCFSSEAFVYLRQKLGKNRAELLRQPGDNRDKYGRLLRYIHFRGEDVGRELLSEGFARFYPWFSHPREEDYNNAQLEAQNAQRGLWGECL